MKRKADIMKIHSYSTTPPHEKVRTRSAVSKEAQRTTTNGTVVRATAAGVSKKPLPQPPKPQQQQQQQPPRKRPLTATPKGASASGASLSPELETTDGRLALEAGKRTGRRRVPRTEDSQEEDPREPTGGPAKRRRSAEAVNTVRAPSSRLRQVRKVDETEPTRGEPKGLGKARESNEADEEDDEEEPEQENLVEDLNEDDRTSSSTVSAEESLQHAMDGYSRKLRTTVSAVNNLKQEKESSVAIDAIAMTMEDYQQQQQHQQEDGDHVAMDEYEPVATVVGGSASASDDIEDTDGALAGNRLFRKKVKRKMVVQPNNSTTGSGGGSPGPSVDGGMIAKAKMQMVHEFPMLFLGLRRNRMFLVHSLAQWFELDHRDIILTLRKIKQNESSARLGNVFGLGATEVDLLFHTNVPKIADCLRNFIVWPDDITMKLNVPINLRQHFQRIHLILNYLVVRMKQNAVPQLPPDEVDSSLCPDEQCHKLKYLVASTLDGCVCFVSRAFGVQTDDEQVLSRSGFLTKFKTNTNLIAGKNFHHFEDRLANGHDHTNNNGGHGARNRVPGSSAHRSSAAGGDEPEHERGEDNFEDIVSEKISKSRTFKLKNYIENILENFQSHQILSAQTCIDGRTLKLLDDIVVIVGALINLQKQEIE